MESSLTNLYVITMQMSSLITGDNTAVNHNETLNLIQLNTES